MASASERTVAWVVVGCLIAIPVTVSAQTDLPTATVLRSQLTGIPAGEGAAFDRTLRARLDALGVVRTESAVALDLEETQLAIGCEGETVECLAPIAEAQHTPVLVIPSLAQAGTSVVATVLIFDQRDSSIRRGTRQAPESDASALLGGVEGLLREVFGLPALAASEPDSAPEDLPLQTTRSTPGLAPAPLVIIGVGAASLVAGAIAGGLSIADASTVASAMPASQSDVNTLIDGTLARQRTEATVADALLIGGAIIAAAGIAWELAAGRDDGSSPLALAPMLSGTQIGFALSGSFGGVL